ncbi:MAG TPA: hypothetical protein VGT02_12825 [Methylomirabilota bacterium]|jgi:hypothetical protein|nr:hypothetical protein [Methylomirabilota bacterium]
MRIMHEVHDMREASTRSLIAVAVILVASALGFTLLTAPFLKLLGSGAGAVAAAFHGLAAFLYLFMGTIGLYLGWRLLTGNIRAFADLQLLSVAGASMSFLAIVFGNWLYIYYRAKTPDSPRSYFVKNMPEIHRIFFEFKEFGALFTLPLMVCAAFLLWRYGAQVLARPWLRYTVAILFGLAFFYLVVAFGLGAAVTKLKAA